MEKNDELVGKVAMLVDKTTKKKTFAELVHCVRTKISAPSGRKCFRFCPTACPERGGGENLRFQVTGKI